MGKNTMPLRTMGEPVYFSPVRLFSIVPAVRSQ